MSKVDNPKLREKSQNFTDYTHASQRSYKFTASSIVKQLNLDIFKITPCNITVKHNHKLCINYHTEKDRRRPGNFYDRTMCSYIEKGMKCPSGDHCVNCHSPVEKQYHLQSYRKCFCTHWPNSINNCPYGDFCAYAHCQEQIQAKLIHNYVEDEDFYMFYYKTQFCILNLTEHQKDKCVYAHNWQDYRRDPSVYNYEPIPCINWNTKDMIYDYCSGCQSGAGCNMCHGWKEQPYHPLYYKTNKCQQKECRRGCCPDYHSQKQKRIIDSSYTNKCFKFIPKNRIVEGLFKDNSLKQGFTPRPPYKQKHNSTISHNKKEDSQNQHKSQSVINMTKSASKFNFPQKKWLDKQQAQSDLEDSEEFQGSNQSLEKIEEQVEKLLD